jgi:hypothetical protein
MAAFDSQLEMACGEGEILTATATETTMMAPEIAAGGLGMFL